MTFASSCGQGSPGGSVGFADGQDPDPVVVDVPIAYIKRPIPLDDNQMLTGNDVREPVTFNAGADVYVRERASPTALETNISGEITQGVGDVKDLSVNAEGTKLVFALREAPLDDVDEQDQPTWNIWEYDLTTTTLRRIIASQINAADGHDVAPAYLPDGRIIFASTRQRKSRAILLDEGKPQYAALDENENTEAFVLHVMNADGTDIRQVSFNQSHDLYPAVAGDGKVLFSRWGAKGGNNAIGLYQANPDGTEIELLYGANSSDTGSDSTDVHFLRAREMPDGRVAVLLQPFEAANLGGQIVVIDTVNFVENEQTLVSGAGMPAPAQLPATANEVRTDALISTGGRYSSFYPLWDGTNRLFVSWSACRVQVADQVLPCTADLLSQPGAQEAAPLYGIWVYDMTTDTQLPVVAPIEGFMYTDVVAAQPQPLPQIRFDQQPGAELDAQMAGAGVGVLNIRSVYDFAGEDFSGPGIAALADPAQFTASQRPARFVRIIKGVSLPDDDVIDVPGFGFGRNRNQGMREIIGYAPIEPDGSVRVKVPADTALAISVLNGDGKRIFGRHQAWITVRPGEEVKCNGCHDAGSGLSHGRSSAFDSINPGALTTSLPFPNTDPALFADFGETMAEARTRISCATDCDALNPTADIVFTDVWTDENAAGRSKDGPFSWRYADLQTAQPVSTACTSEWQSHCRIVIHYEQHIHPLWVLPRQTLDADGVTVLEDHTCTSCHNIVDADGVAQVPAAQLDLSDGRSDQNANQFKSYRELLFNDTELELDMGALQERLVIVGIDADTGEPVFAPVNVSRSMSANGALSSGAFFAPFLDGTHEGYLSPAELKLLSEWLDIGAQYFNDPFAVPQD
ncbi:MAG: hypothetical protein HKN70_13575 [Gammaproteobacteria bacterium]|nr:hypothetical protein [Gammaproteobacteria bacterium]